MEARGLYNASRYTSSYAPNYQGAIMKSHSISEPRLRLLAARLHNLGPRPLAEFLREIVAGADPVGRLGWFAEFDPALLVALGANVLPPVALLIAGGGNG